MRTTAVRGGRTQRGLTSLATTVVGAASLQFRLVASLGTSGVSFATKFEQLAED